MKLQQLNEAKQKKEAGQIWKAYLPSLFINGEQEIDIVKINGNNITIDFMTKIDPKKPKQRLTKELKVSDIKWGAQVT